MDLEVILPIELGFNFQLVDELGLRENISVWRQIKEI